MGRNALIEDLVNAHLAAAGAAGVGAGSDRGRDQWAR